MSKKYHCQICKIEIFESKKGRPPKFCSKKCYNLNRSQTRPYNYKGELEKICSNCKNKFTHSRSTNKKHCSRECYDLSRNNGFKPEEILNLAMDGKKYYEIAEEVGIDASSVSRMLTKIGHKKHPTRKNYRFIALNNIKILKCKKCGYYEFEKILIVHHLDGDRKNNKKENLCVLCPNCHALAHLTERGVNYRKLNKNFII